MPIWDLRVFVCAGFRPVVNFLPTKHLCLALAVNRQRYIPAGPPIFGVRSPDKPGRSRGGACQFEESLDCVSVVVVVVWSFVVVLCPGFKP